MKYQVLFFPKQNEKIFKTVVCCSSDWFHEGSQRAGPRSAVGRAPDS